MITDNTLSDLKARFPDGVFFLKDELIGFQLSNSSANAVFFLQGGQITECVINQQSLLWHSDLSTFQVNKSIRGGIPVCWPWFGRPEKSDQQLIAQLKNHTNNIPSLPQHGFARTALWNLESISSTDEALKVTFQLTNELVNHKSFPYQFELTLSYIITDKLYVRLTTHNKDTRPFVISQALHTYLPIEQITESGITGVDGKEYTDTLDQWKTKTQQGSLPINRNIDRIYHADAPISLHDKLRTTKITSEGSKTTVIWNPWTDSIKELSDCRADAYLDFVCIETANSLKDSVKISPNDSHTLTATISVSNN